MNLSRVYGYLPVIFIYPITKRNHIYIYSKAYIDNYKEND